MLEVDGQTYCFVLITHAFLCVSFFTQTTGSSNNAEGKGKVQSLKAIHPVPADNWFLWLMETEPNLAIVEATISAGYKNWLRERNMMLGESER